MADLVARDICQDIVAAVTKNASTIRRVRHERNRVGSRHGGVFCLAKDYLAHGLNSNGSR